MSAYRSVKESRPSDRWKGETAANFVAARLREEIIEGNLQPGEQLVLTALAQRFDVSVIPVREALRVLDAEGLVTLRNYRSAVVASFPLEDLQDLYRVRILLEVEAGRLASAHQVDGDGKGVARMIDEMENALLSADYFAAMSLHKDIHLALYRPAASPVLIDLITTLLDRSEPYNAFGTFFLRNDPKTFADNHRRLADAILQGDRDTAATAVQNHLEAVLSELTRLLRAAESHDRDTRASGVPPADGDELA